MGMSPREYWEGSPQLTAAYREAFRIRKEERNFELWLQGLYFYHAISIALHNTLTSAEPLEYMSEPIKIFPPTEEEIREQQEKEAKELEKVLNAFAERVRKRDEQH